MSFGTHLKECRRTAGLTQRQLAIRAGCNHTYISKLEHDAMPNKPSYEALWGFSVALNCDPDEMFRKADKTPPDVTSIVARGGPDLWKRLREGKV